jgi:hypothetical protein
MNKNLLIMSIVTVILGTALFFYIIFLLYWPVKTLEVKNFPMPIVGTEFYPGGTVTYHYDYCKYYDTPLSIRKDFVDGIIYQTDGAVGMLERGCHKKNVTINIPGTLQPGTYKLRITTQIVVNKLRTDTRVYETQQFEIKERIK